jgi:hypothetical protein
MKTFAELMALDDEAFAWGIYNGFTSDTPLEPDLEFTRIFQELMFFPSYIACNSFHSIYYQTVFPGDWPDYERLLGAIGAHRYATLLRRGRELYFNGEYLPTSNEEWRAFRSPVWDHPDSDSGIEFARLSAEVEDAYHSDGVVRKLGAYIRSNWSALFKPKCERA